MSRPRCKRSTQTRKTFLLQKPNGELTPRVRKVGPEHFGIVAIDCGKRSSRYLLANFYGQALLEPTPLPHTRGAFQAAIDRLRQAMSQHELRDLVVALDRAAESIRPVQRPSRQPGLETGLVHPFTSKQSRHPADPGNKTDD